LRPVSSEIFAEGGLAASEMPSYEARPQQLAMAEAVERAIETERHLIAEAGTGTGKSLAYLVPFIFWAVRENKKVVVSTFTKTLQNQLAIKDLPLLSRILDVEFRYSLCMGSENYLCLRKAAKAGDAGLFRKKKEKEEAGRLAGWARETETGLSTDLDFVPSSSVWKRFSRQADMCRLSRCPHKERCFYRRARKEQQDSHILITNHALLFSDIASEARLLPEFHGLVVDEAHTLEDVATNHFGSSVSGTAYTVLLGEITRTVSSGEMPFGLAQLKEHVNKASYAVSELMKEVDSVYGAEMPPGARELERGRFDHSAVRDAFEELASTLAALARDAGDEDSESELGAYSLRCRDISERTEAVFCASGDPDISWLEAREKGGKRSYSFRSAPVDVSEKLNLVLFDRVSPVVLTSATLSSSQGGRKADFSFFKKRTGLDACDELSVGSPFDHANNVLIFIPCDVPDPNKEAELFRGKVVSYTEDLYDIMGGRIFVLFTSYNMMDRVGLELNRTREDIKTFKQGDFPRYVLLDLFKRDRESLLLGTTSFWQGVDVPGRSLEAVVITRLPFASPQDPVKAARIKRIREAGGDPFSEYQLPQAVIMFKQGFGRLIRSRSDRGIVAVLDPRVRTRSYGRQFTGALPECRVTSSLSDVRDFFSEKEEAQDEEEITLVPDHEPHIDSEQEIELI